MLAAGGDIPDSPWFILAKVDAAEIFAPIAAYARMTGLLLLALVAGSGLGLAFIWRNQQAAFYRRQFETEHDKLALAQRYEYLTKYANDIILLADQDLRLVEANERAVESYGYGRDELLRLTLPDLHPPETRPLLTENLQRAGERDGRFLSPASNARTAPPFRWKSAYASWKWMASKIYQEIIRDVTERKLAEEALRRSEAGLAEAQHLAHLGRWEWDIRENKEFWSDEGYRNFGLEPQELLPTHETFMSFIHPEDLPLVKEQVAEALKSGQFGPFDYRIVRRDGSIRFLNSRGETYFDPEGRPLKMVGTAQDITERKLVEEALRRSEGHLAEAQRLAHWGPGSGIF